MKKLIAVVYVLLLAASFQAVPASAQNTPGWTVGRVEAQFPNETIVRNRTPNGLADSNAFAGLMNLSSDAHALWGPSSTVSPETGYIMISLPYRQYFEWQGMGPPNNTIYASGDYTLKGSATVLPSNPGESYADSSFPADSGDTRNDPKYPSSETYTNTGTYYPIANNPTYAFEAYRDFTLKTESYAANDYYDYGAQAGSSGASSSAEFTCNSAS